MLTTKCMMTYFENSNFEVLKADVNYFVKDNAMVQSVSIFANNGIFYAARIMRKDNLRV